MHSYEALEAEAEDRRRSLRLITAARAGRVVERQQSASPVRILRRSNHCSQCITLMY